MGKLFEYIADKVVISEYISFYDECHVCGKRGSMILRSCGYIYEGDDLKAFQKGFGVSAACIDCIKSGKIIPFGEGKFTDFLRRNYKNWKELRDELRKIPHTPRIKNNLDWPVCCDKLSEFEGFPESFNELSFVIENTKRWDSKNKAQLCLLEINPEYLSDVSMFRCRNCGKKYWIYQNSF